MPPKGKSNPGHGGVPPGKRHKKKQNDHDSDLDSKNGEQGTFDTYNAEANTFQKATQFKKAIESYTKALELRPGDKNCLVARSKCYLQLGDSETALADAETTLSDDPTFIQGLYQKAEALYRKGDFEFALVFYHRGQKLRPEVNGFRLGIQKAREAIDNCIGDSAGLQLENKGDLSYFYKQEEDEKNKKKQKQGGYSKPAAKKDSKKEERKQLSSAKDSKTVKQLLGELYADREYLEKLLKDEDLTQRKSDTSKDIRNLAYEGILYLDTRSEFWQQQKPMYSRKRDKQMRNKSSRRDRADPTNYVLKNLEEIDAAQTEGRHKDSLKQAKRALKEVERWSDDDVPNRQEVIANLHSCIGNAYLEMQDYDKAHTHHQRDLEIANQYNMSDAKSRALDNIGRVHARNGKFEKAIEVWKEKLPLSKSALEQTWLYHEIGRCHLELGHFQDAKDHGEKSLASAEEASDDIWQLNASVLIAQSEVKLGNHQNALDYFEKSLDMAKLQEDSLAESAIKKAIDDVNQRIVKELKDGDDKGSHKGDDTYGDDFEEQDRPGSAKSAKSHKSDKSAKSNEVQEEQTAD